jgi:hypothetical protein
VEARGGHRNGSCGHVVTYSIMWGALLPKPGNIHTRLEGRYHNVVFHPQVTDPTAATLGDQVYVKALGMRSDSTPGRQPCTT